MIVSMDDETRYPIVITGYAFHQTWGQLISTIARRGSPCNPRKKPTREILNVTLYVGNARENVLVNSVRNPNYRSMIAEWLWIQFGFWDVKSIGQYIKKYYEFSDDGKYLTGAYGPRVVDNVHRCIEQLKQDPETRQAVLPIWKQGQEIPSKDVPCTISLQFLIRGSQLHTVVNMRSSDAWLGLVYDFFVFSQIAQGVAAEVEIEMGSLTMHLGSSHLYEENLKHVHEALEVKSSTLTSPQFPSYPDYILMDAFANCNLVISEEKFKHELWFDYYKVLRQANRVESLETLKEMQGKNYASR